MSADAKDRNMHHFPEMFSVKHYTVIMKVIRGENERQISGSPNKNGFDTSV